jgi:hypothetical protein
MWDILKSLCRGSSRINNMWLMGLEIASRFLIKIDSFTTDEIMIVFLNDLPMKERKKMKEITME